jgi:hypothetical protein
MPISPTMGELLPYLSDRWFDRVQELLLRPPRPRTVQGQLIVSYLLSLLSDARAHTQYFVSVGRLVAWKPGAEPHATLAFLRSAHFDRDDLPIERRHGRRSIERRC